MGIITNSYLHHLYLRNDSRDLCGMAIDTILHALRDCGYTKSMWSHLVNRQHQAIFFSSSLMDWINIKFSPSSHSFNDNWFDLWAFSCHQIIWIWRNKRIHDPLFVMPLNPILDIQNYVWIFRKSKQLLLKVNPIARNPISVHWNPLASGWVCLNSNGLLRLILVPDR